MSHAPRQRVSTGSPFEPKVGISRAVRSGRIIAVTGTAPLGPDGKTVAKGDAAAQARRCFEIIQSAIEGLGGRLSDVLRTRILLTRHDRIRFNFDQPVWIDESHNLHDRVRRTNLPKKFSDMAPMT